MGNGSVDSMDVLRLCDRVVKVMAHFLPHMGKIGCYLYSRGDDATSDERTVPVFRINSIRAPVVSSLNSGDPRYRLISYLVSPYSPPFSSIRSYEPALCRRQDQLLVAVDMTPLRTMTEAIDSNRLKPNLPPEYGLCIQNEFIHSSSFLRLSKPSYEVVMHLNRFYAFAACYEGISGLLDAEHDLCQHYELPSVAASRAELHNQGYNAINARYESFTRFMCGGDLEAAEDMPGIIEFLMSDFQSCLLAENIDDPVFKMRYTIHRSVSRRIKFLKY